MLQDPSFAAQEFTTAPKTVATEFSADYPYGHALRAKGTGTITVTTAAGTSVALNVDDGETVVLLFTEVTAVSGVTAYRIQVPKPFGKTSSYPSA
jgi:hypothetical protein